ncbi:MAG: hypothetical protein JEZ12_02865 [Desulfobacterium sp.]|nr:hypothetical protein [Desulfobacterium sp.]
MQIETNFYTIAVYTSICHVTVYSSWDERVMEDYIKHRTGVVSNLYTGKKWAILMDMREWTLHAPDAEKTITQIIKRTFFQKPSNYAVIVGKSEIKKWQVNKSFTETDKVHIKYFETLDEGKSWLTSLGYKMTPLDTPKNDL